MAADFEACILQTTDLTSNIDLEQLGFIILECMAGRPCQELRDHQLVHQQRKEHKMFGLQDEHSQRWSGNKLLVDFLDNLFNQTKPSIAKLDRPVSEIS